jgi:hypothetical protein
MKKMIHILPGLSVFLVALRLSAAPPSNDMFENRIDLAGSDLMTAGSVVGATSQYGEVWSGSGGFGGTVWWSWTAPESVPATLLIERVNPRPVPGEVGTDAMDYLTVWRPPDLSGGFPTNSCSGCKVLSLPLYFGDHCPNGTFNSVAGTTYYFQLRGTSTNQFNLRLIATNAPVVVEAPRSQAVSPGGAALFTVIAAGVRPLGYQWRFNGNDLPGETSPMLTLTNIIANQAGSYLVVVSNATGMTTTESATLSVNGEETGSHLTTAGMTGAGQFGFHLCGDTGRFYRVEFSTNLMDWQPARSFVDPRSQYFLSSIVFAGSGCLSLEVAAETPRKFIRVVRYAPTNEVCNIRLKQIRFAKELWVRDNHLGSAATPTGPALRPYFKDQQIPGCPGGGTFFFQQASSAPVCSIPSHVLEEPR